MNIIFLGMIGITELILIIPFILAVALVPGILYLLTLQNVLKKVSPENRLVPAENVWLMLIPLFNLVYPFILYPKISDSIANEYEARGMNPDGDFGKGLGTAMPILGLCSVIPLLGLLSAIGYFVVWIIFWVKMSEYKNNLA
jgi:hypothetical protein